jgi:hypothetical protein
MSSGDGDRRRSGDQIGDEERRAREREAASRQERDSADGPGYTSRPTGAEPEAEEHTPE